MTPIQLTIPEIFEAAATQIQEKINSAASDSPFIFHGACIEIGRVIFPGYFYYHDHKTRLEAHPAYKVFAALYKRPGHYWFGALNRENAQRRVHALLLAAEFSRHPSNLKGIL